MGWILHVSTPTGVRTILSKPGTFVIPCVIHCIQLFNSLYEMCLLLDIFTKAVIGFGSKETIYHKFIGGSSVLTADGEEYKRHRKVKSVIHFKYPVHGTHM